MDSYKLLTHLEKGHPITLVEFLGTIPKEKKETAPTQLFLAAVVYRKKIIHFFLTITTTKHLPNDGEGDVTIVLSSESGACCSVATIVDFKFPVIVVTSGAWKVWM